MKELVKILLGCGALAIAANTAMAQLNIQVSLDENGNGVITGGAAAGLPDPYPLPGVLALDPISGLTTLSYALPTTVTAGDLLLVEPGQTAFSDLIRFGLTAAGHPALFFFSDREATDVPPFDLADVGVPNPNPNGIAITLNEVGPEGNNGAIWKPLSPGDPGFAAAVGPSVTYNIISDVPEPSSLALLGLGGGVVALVWRQRVRRT